MNETAQLLLILLVAFIGGVILAFGMTLGLFAMITTGLSQMATGELMLVIAGYTKIYTSVSFLCVPLASGAFAGWITQERDTLD